MCPPSHDADGWDFGVVSNHPRAVAPSHLANTWRIVVLLVSGILTGVQHAPTNKEEDRVGLLPGDALASGVRLCHPGEDLRWCVGQGVHLFGVHGNHNSGKLAAAKTLHTAGIRVLGMSS